jgi:hypothetical protein
VLGGAGGGEGAFLYTGGEPISAALACGDAAASATTETPARRVIRSPRRVDCISLNSGVSKSQLLVSIYYRYYYEELFQEAGVVTSSRQCVQNDTVAGSISFYKHWGILRGPFEAVQNPQKSLLENQENLRWLLKPY